MITLIGVSQNVGSINLQTYLPSSATLVDAISF